MLINLIKLAGLLFLLGGPLFYLWIWHPVFHDQPSLNTALHARIKRLLPIAAGLYLIGIVLQTLLYRPVDGGVVTYALPLLTLIAVPLLVSGFAALATHTQRGFLLVGLSGLTLLLIETAASHAAADPGWLPFAGQLVHLLAAIVWTAALGFLFFAPWPELARAETLHKHWQALDQKISRLVMLMFILVAVTGALLAFVHVHSEAARIFTPYGQALSLKLLLSALLTLVLGVHLVRTAPLLKRLMTGQADSVTTLRKYRRLIRFEALVVLVVALGSTLMKQHEPPATAPFLNPQTLTLSVDLNEVRVSMQPVAGNLNSVRMEIFLPTALAGGDATQVFFNLVLPDAQLETGRREALRVSNISYQGEATFPAPGEWQLQLDITAVSGQSRQLVLPLSIPAQPLIGDIATYLSPQAVLYSHANMITVVTGLVLLLVYGVLGLRAGRGAYPQWSVLAGIAGVLFGLYLVFSVALVKTYPSTYAKNPLPLTDSVVARGQAAYSTACAECHGSTGKGDGRWAIQNRGGAIPDLGSPHMDVHTDGEIYWWILRGIPELDMPAREQELTEDQRWEIVNYLRSLRHGTTGP